MSIKQVGSRIRDNVLKGLITSTIGTLTMLITLFLVFTGKMTFVWNGAVGLLIGAVLLIAPQKIDKIIIAAAKGVMGGDNGEDCEQHTETPKNDGTN